MAEHIADTTETSSSRLALPEVARANPMQKSSYRLALAIQSASMLLDVISIFLTFWIAYEMRYTYRIGAIVPVGRDTLEFSQWARHALAAIIFTLIVYLARGVY